MTSHVRPTPITDELYDYVLRVGLREPPQCKLLREETATLKDGEWQTAPEQGPLFDLFVKLLNAKRVLEVGTFTGYGTLWFALASNDVRITTLDVSEAFTSVGKKHWQAAGVAERIELILAPAVETLKTLPAGYDLAYIDADKDNVLSYYEECLRLVRPGGIVMIDNTLWDGRPADVSNSEASTVAIRSLNGKIHSDDRVDLCFLPFADGLTIVRKR